MTEGDKRLLLYPAMILLFFAVPLLCFAILVL